MNSELKSKHAHASAASSQAADLSLLEEQINRLKSRMHFAVIFGGNKSAPDSVVYRQHNTRSWKSYEEVALDIAGSLTRLGFRHVELIPDDMRLADRLRRRHIHMAWLNTGGVQGYNPTAHAPSMLEMMGVPYVGHDPLAASTLDNKHAFKRVAVSAGLPTPRFTTWHMERGSFRPDLNSRFKRVFGGYDGPFVIKPVSGRASLHVNVIPDVASLPDAIADVYRATENAVLIEEFLPGREVCVAVAGPITAPGGGLVRGNRPVTFASLERVLTDGEQIFTSMDKRPITEQRLKPLDPVADANLLAAMRQLAHETYLEFNLCGLIRLDLRADEHGKLFILEANPKPDLKKPAAGVTSLISAGLPEVGLTYDELMLSLLADRLDFLFAHRRGTVKHLLELIESPNLFDLMGAPASAALQQAAAAPDLQASLICDLAADVSVHALNATLRAAEGRKEPAAARSSAERSGAQAA